MPMTAWVWVIVADGVGDGPGDAEVHDLDAPVGVSMTLAGLMSRCTMPARWLYSSAARTPDVIRERPPASPACELLGEQLAHGAALDVLHDDVRHLDRRAAGLGDEVLAAVVDRDDRRVVERRGGLGLAAEPLVELRVPRQVGAQHLDGDGAAEAGVVADVDLGHPAAAEQLAHLVASAEQAGRVAHVVPSCLRGRLAASVRTQSSPEHRLDDLSWRSARRRVPPYASLPALPPSSTTTATATLGLSAGAKAVNHACGRLARCRAGRCRSCRRR